MKGLLRVEAPGRRSSYSRCHHGAASAAVCLQVKSLCFFRVLSVSSGFSLALRICSLDFSSSDFLLVSPDLILELLTLWICLLK